MALFEQKTAPIAQVKQLREQGLTDNIIHDELSKQGHAPDQITKAITQADQPMAAPAGPSAPAMPPGGPAMPGPAAPAAPDKEMGNIYERIEEITESMIDDKWDDLIAEVKKIVDWKEKFQEQQGKMAADLDKLKEDFKVLHQGVLGKLEDYDSKMQDVGTELKAVGKVFKDVIPTFVDNVKELSSITGKVKKK